MANSVQELSSLLELKDGNSGNLSIKQKVETLVREMKITETEVLAMSSMRIDTYLQVISEINQKG